MKWHDGLGIDWRTLGGSVALVAQTASHVFALIGNQRTATIGGCLKPNLLPYLAADALHPPPPAVGRSVAYKLGAQGSSATLVSRDRPGTLGVKATFITLVCLRWQIRVESFRSVDPCKPELVLQIWTQTCMYVIQLYYAAGRIRIRTYACRSRSNLVRRSRLAMVSVLCLRGRPESSTPPRLEANLAMRLSLTRRPPAPR